MISLASFVRVAIPLLRIGLSVYCANVRCGLVALAVALRSQCGFNHIEPVKRSSTYVLPRKCEVGGQPLPSSAP